MKSVIFVTGSRAEWGLLEPLYSVCIKEFETDLIVTGSHLSKQFGYTADGIDQESWYKIESLADGDTSETISTSMGIGLIKAGMFFSSLPDLLVCLGDRYEILAVCLAGYNAGIPIVHIEGSDTTLGSLDEGYRNCIRSLSPHHFDIEQYGSLGCVFPKNLKPNSEYEVIVAYHPYKGDYEGEFRAILEAIEGYRYLVVGSNADAGGRLLNSLMPELVHANCDFKKSLPRREYLEYLSGAKFIIGNSSSGIIEAPSLKIPSIDVGDRQKGRKRAGSVGRCNGASNVPYAVNYLNNYRDELDYTNPYEKPNTIDLMMKKLKSI